MKTSICRFRPITLGILVLSQVCVVGLGGCVRTPQQKAARYIEAGKKQMVAKDYAAALLQFRNASKETPKDPEPLYQSGLAYLRQTDVAAAIGSFQKAVSLDPKHVGAQLELSRIMIAASRPDLLREVEKKLEELERSVPSNLDVLQQLATVQIGLGELDKAEANLFHIVEVQPRHLDANMSLALLKLARKDPAGAEAQLKKAASENPKSVEPMVALGRFYSITGQQTEAIAEFQKALQVDDKQPAALMGLGAIYKETQQKDVAAGYYRRLAALPDQEYRQVYVSFLQDTGDAASALAELEKVVQRNPRDRDARAKLVRAYLGANRKKDAEKILADSLYANSKDPQALLLRAEIYLSDGRLQDAEADMNKMLTSHPESGEAHVLLAQVHQKRGNTLTQRGDLTEALRLNPELLGARLDLVQNLLASNNARAALDILDGTPTFQAGSLALMTQRNAAYLMLGNYSAARIGIDKALATSRAPDLLNQDGYLRLQQGDPKRAMASFEEALKLVPEDIQALEGVVASLKSEKQPALALARIRQQAALVPRSAAIQRFLGNELMQSGDRSGARTALMAAKALDPSVVAADFNLVRLDIAEGKRDAARERLQTMIQAGQEEADARLMLGMLEDASGNAKSATEQYRKVVELDSRNVLGLNNLAFQLAEAGQLDEALKYAQAARELSPNSRAAIDDTVGWIYYRKGIYRMAVQYLETALNKEKTARRAYHLAMAYMKMGDLKSGEKTLALAKTMDSTIPEAGQAEVVREQAKALVK